MNSYKTTKVTDFGAAAIKQRNGVISICGYVNVKAISAGTNMDIAVLPNALLPANNAHTYVPAYCYDDAATALIWVSGGKINLYKPTKATADNKTYVFSLIYTSLYPTAI